VDLLGRFSDALTDVAILKEIGPPGVVDPAQRRLYEENRPPWVR
jgi:hypothetical protein